MKILSFFLIALIVFSTISSVSAFNENISFSNYSINSQLDVKQKELNVLVQFKVERKPFYDYVAIISIDGKKYRKTLIYNESNNVVFANLTTRYSSIPTIVTYSLEILDENNKSKYTTSWTINIVSGSTHQNPVVNIPNPPVVNVSNNQQTANRSSSLIIANIRSQNSTTQSQVQSLLNAIIQINQDSIRFPNQTQIFNLIKYNLENEIRRLYGLNPATNVPVTNPTTNKYIPKYKNPSEEPARINGIGNSTTRNSWRVSN